MGAFIKRHWLVILLTLGFLWVIWYVVNRIEGELNAAEQAAQSFLNLPFWPWNWISSLASFVSSSGTSTAAQAISSPNTNLGQNGALPL
jgi:hypothetical protein